MKITNLHGLPEPLVRAVSFSDRKRGTADFTVTELIKPPRIAALEHIYDEVLEEDASDRLWLLMGSAGHEVLRRSSAGGIVEERCEVEFKGRKISGQLDYAVHDYAIYDYKFTSMYAIKEGVKSEWAAQMNLYKWMADQYGVVVKDLKIIAILRDWSKPEAARDKSVPQSQVVVMPVTIWPTAFVEGYIDSRIYVHELARKSLPECSAEDMWERPERYAVMKKGNVRATKVLDTKGDAGVFIVSQAKPMDYNIEVRPSERPRCEHYCSVAKFCTVFQDWKRART